MKLRFCFILSVVILLASCCQTDMVTGRVMAEGKGVANIVVSDGYSVATTDMRGKYCFKPHSDARFVWISTPAGYESPVENGVPIFFSPITEGKKKHDFKVVKKSLDDIRHGFIVVADPQIWHEKEFSLLSGAAEDIRNTVNSYNGMAFHGIGSGDIIASDHSFYPQYNMVMSESGIVFRNAMGNHDMTNYGRSHSTSETAYEKVYGPSYYSYNVGKVHYVVLNNNFFIGREWYYIGYLPEAQLSWLEKDLSLIAEGSTVVVTAHIPTTVSKDDRKSFAYRGIASTMVNHSGLYDILKPFNVHIISGHTHTMANEILNPTLREHNTAALSGAWWQGELCTDGTPSGYGVYEVDGEDIKWYYKSTAHPKEHQMRIYHGRRYKEFDGFVVANIWNSDPEWRAELYADGKLVSVMERFEAYDPIAREMYANTDGMDHKWIYPSASDHFYRAPIPRNAKLLEVVATDNFGNVYRDGKLTINL